MSHLSAPIAASASLRDGASISLRAVGPEDRACIARGFERLSAASRLSRFLMPMQRLDGPMLDYLTAIDGSRHLAVAACTDPASSGDVEPVGLARCVRLDGEPDVAEIAVTVMDPWQRRGVAPVLVSQLARWADAVAIRKFRALFGYDNRAITRLIAGAGIALVPDGSGMLRADIEVPLILKIGLRFAAPASA